MSDEHNQTYIALYLAGTIPVIWIALLLAPYLFRGGIFAHLADMTNALNNPLSITWMEDSLKTIFLFLCIYGAGIGIYYSTKKNYRRGEEHGSAKWGSITKVNKKYSSKKPIEDKILTQNVRISYKSRKHRRNLLTLICGGSGAGKTRFYAKPNLLQGNTSFVVLDPKGELTRDTGHMLKKTGYEVRVLDLINMDKSFCYNPFAYLKNDNDVQKLVTNLFKATTPKGSQSQDPFWDTAASMLLLALIFYLKYEAPEDEQNFPMVMEMLRAGEVHEDDDYYQSPLDVLFFRLEQRDPNHIAVKYYRDYHSGSAKTLKSIQITLAARLEKFNLESLSKLTQTDELDMTSIGEKKVALFAIIPDNDTSFNFLISILYTQLFQQLFWVADHKYHGRLPVHVHFLMDEFANVSLPDDFDKILSVMRSREVSVSIILQNLAQLKALFEKQWESIVGNCDEFLYLGGNEQSTHKYVSELLGKATIDTNTYGKSTGHSGNYSTNYQNNGRELLTPDEVRLLDNELAILFIRGERPIMDKKYEITHHPNVSMTPDNGDKDLEYHHGEITEAIASVSLTYDIDDALDFDLSDAEFVFADE
ncbi:MULTISPECIES: VirD4-like conjugal transfer protein, CD1115 family [Coprobacillaceae]|uniref:TraG/TraD family protein n=5 Tax=Bacteria TaxID=2 RepID=E7G783_9FIRM|nr:MULTISPECIES: type IV secretory system conjugative DNA transfer family protein [Coprobacillaceae]EFW06161.1 TraG/TraD family protein [Coprobacillus cateniformis]RGD83797.1 type IV secretory system conjugative DNA transfer family protein [Thomasclavelia ramosa]RGY43722.1 type IV secretory system conjugative DNA transfer family protein [Coprobacillus cateniformis]